MNSHRIWVWSGLYLPIVLAAILFLKPIDFMVYTLEYAIFSISVVISWAVRLFLSVEIKKVRFHFDDILWIAFLILAFSSASYSINSYFSIYHSITLLSLYLFYKNAQGILSNFETRSIAKEILYFVLVIVIFQLFISGIMKGVSKSGLDLMRLFSGMSFNFANHANYISTLLILLIFIEVSSNRVKTKIEYFIVILASVIVLLSPSQWAKIVLILLGSLGILLSIIKSSGTALRNITIVLSLSSVVILGLFLFNSDLGKNQFTKLVFEANDNDDRFVMWQKTKQLISEQPILGVGFGNWKPAIKKFGIDGYERETNPFVAGYPPHPHNLSLSLISEIGILGFLLFIGIFLFPVMYAFKKRKFYREWTFLFLGIVAYFLLSQMYGSIFLELHRFKGTLVLLFFMLALIRFPYQRSFNLIHAPILFLFLGIGCAYWFTTDSLKEKKYESSFALLNNEQYASLAIKDIRQSSKHSIKNVYSLNKSIPKLMGKHNFIKLVDHNEYLSRLINPGKKVRDSITLDKKERLRYKEYAINWYKEALTIDPYDISIITSLSTLYLRNYEYDKARELALRAYQQNNSNYYVLVLLASIELKDGNKGAALNYLKFSGNLSEEIKRLNTQFNNAPTEKRFEYLKRLKAINTKVKDMERVIYR